MFLIIFDLPKTHLAQDYKHAQMYMTHERKEKEADNIRLHTLEQILVRKSGALEGAGKAQGLAKRAVAQAKAAQHAVAQALAAKQMLRNRRYRDNSWSTAADKRADKVAARQSRQLGQSPTRQDRASRALRSTVRDRHIWQTMPRGLNSRQQKEWEYNRDKSTREYVRKVHELQVRERKRNSRPDFKYEGMTAQAAQVGPF